MSNYELSIVSSILDKTSSTKLVIILYMKQTPREFVDWLNAEMKKRNWGTRETARNVGVSHPTISDIISAGYRPSFDTVIALEKTFGGGQVFLLRLSGLIDPEPEYVPMLDQWNDVFYDLTEEDRQDIIEFAKIKAGKRKQPDKLIKKRTSRRGAPARTALIEE
jgi:plasmid maintenance system antidote protein VapI